MCERYEFLKGLSPLYVSTGQAWGMGTAYI